MSDIFVTPLEELAERSWVCLVGKSKEEEDESK